MDSLVEAIRGAAVFNPEVQVAPACILWTDHDRQWEPVIPVLQSQIPELMVLGDYAPEQRRGPAIWLRCVVAARIPEISWPKERPPIFYLPGVSRQDLRAIETCPTHLKPLAELQYRGVIWSQINSKDWTILAYLKSGDGGLGLDVAQDNDTKSAMRLAVHRVLDEEVSRLKGKRLDKDDFNTLLAGGDLMRDVLQWLDLGDVWKGSRDDNEWKAFGGLCQSHFGFDPDSKGILSGCTQLAKHEGPWQAVWERYREAPQRYPNIPKLIRNCQMPKVDLFSDEKVVEGWPQWNEEQENSLRQDLLRLANEPPHRARQQILDQENTHGRRRSWVWAEIGEAPLACASEHLAVVAELTKTSLAAGTIDDIVAGYRAFGWRVDDAMLRALAHVERAADVDAVKAAIRSVYLPWLEESARYLQKIVEQSSYLGAGDQAKRAIEYCDGDCVLFVDGLRFDVGKRLVESLQADGFDVSEELVWAALPSVTATGKAAVSPVRDKIQGRENTPDFEPVVAQTGQSLKGGQPLKKLLTDAGWSIIARTASGDGQGMAWCEVGDIDHEGHERGWKLAKHVGGLVQEIRERIAELLAAGWKRVRVVTDHGWLLLPGGLPKIELPSVLTENKWGRCASLKSGSSTKERLYPWFWDPHQFFALADGVSCFKKGEEYAHGGLSLQECLLSHLTVTHGTSMQTKTFVRFREVRWKNLRCNVTVEGEYKDLFLDIRSHAGSPSSSLIVGAKKPLNADGKASVVVEDEDLEGRHVEVVLLDAKGVLVAQVASSVGGGER